MNLDNPHIPVLVRNSLLSVAVLAALTACVHKPPGSNVDDIPVNIIFNDSNCPHRVDPEKPVNVSKASGQRIAWKAVNEEGKPVEQRFRIYFDPFKGRPLRSNPHGDIRSPRIAADTPINVEYKYTIEGEKCDGPALDPRFFLD